MRTSQQAKFLSVMLAAAMSVAALVLNAVTWEKITHSIGDLEHALEIKLEWEKLMSSLKDAETGERGFLLTGNEEYLEPLDSAKNALDACFARLRKLGIQDQVFQKKLDEMRELMRARLDLATEKITIRRREGLDAAIAIVQTNRGKMMMDAIREKVSSLIGEQQKFIQDRTQVMETDLWWGYFSAISTGVIALLAGGVALLLLRESAHQARREERLAAEKIRAEESNRQKSTFLASMSHEIRTPMNAILGFSELLEAEVTTEKQKRYTKSILTGGRSLLQLINDILDLSKIEAGMMHVKPEPTDVRDVERFLHQLFTWQAANEKVAFRTEIPESLPHSLLLDSARLRQILVNVVGNAFKFTTKGHVLVRFSSEAFPDKLSRIALRIEVEDTGEGIPAQQQGDIFKPFVQAGAHPDGARQRGTGLGLTIVSRLVGLMGGTVTLSSDVGVGSTFRLDFPDVEISARLPQGSAAEEPAVNFDDLRPSSLLVADDNETNRDLVKGIFENTHHRVRLASDGAEALQAVLAERPDLVLMDIRMPDMDGREALLAIRAHPDLNLLPVVAVTASSLASEERELRHSFDGYVRKPFSRAQLYHEIAQFIPKRDAAGSIPSVLESAEQPLPPDEAQRWRDLAVRLRDLEREVWPGVRDGMVMSEVQRFAAGLQEAAVTAQCPPLEAYAALLSGDAEAFAISTLEQRLAEFPARLAEIERRASPSPP